MKGIANVTFLDYKTMFEAWALEILYSDRMYTVLLPENNEHYDDDVLIKNTQAWEIAYLIVKTVS